MISWYIESTLIGPRSSLEITLHVLEAFRQLVDVVGVAVDVHRRPRRRGHAVAQASGAGAVVTDAHGDTTLVEQLPDVMRVDAVESERDRAAAVVVGRRPDDAQAVDLLKSI